MRKKLVQSWEQGHSSRLFFENMVSSTIAMEFESMDDARTLLQCAITETDGARAQERAEDLLQRLFEHPREFELIRQSSVGIAKVAGAQRLEVRANARKSGREFHYRNV